MSDLLQDHIHAPEPYDDEESKPPSRALVQLKRDLAQMSFEEQGDTLAPGSPDHPFSMVDVLQRRLEPEGPPPWSPRDPSWYRQVESSLAPSIQRRMERAERAEQAAAGVVQMEAEPTAGRLPQAPDVSMFKDFVQIMKAVNLETVGIYGPELDTWLTAAAIPGPLPGAAMKALVEILKLVNPVMAGIYGAFLDAWASTATGPDVIALLPMLARIMLMADPRSVAMYGPPLLIWSIGGAPNAAAAEALAPEPVAMSQPPPPEVLTGPAPAPVVILTQVMQDINPDALGAAMPAIEGFLADPTNWDLFAEAASLIMPDQAGAIEEWVAAGSDLLALPEILGPDVDQWAAAVQSAVAVAGPMALEPIQAKSDGGGPSPDAVKAAAAEGIRGSGGQLPHLERIQAAFGGHDISGVEAHVGGAAADASKAMGAMAYTTGSKVAFKNAPDLHTAAHEAAHVIQQRQGVSIPSGVGEVGDSYEKHADAVADRVVSGHSAADLLGGGGGPDVQAKVQQTEEPQAAETPVQQAKPKPPATPPPLPTGAKKGGAKSKSGNKAPNASAPKEDPKKKLLAELAALNKQTVEPTTGALVLFREEARRIKTELAKLNVKSPGNVDSLIDGSNAAEKALSDATGQSLATVASFKTQVESAKNACSAKPFSKVKSDLALMAMTLTNIIARDQIDLDGASAAVGKYNTYKGTADKFKMTTLSGEIDQIVAVLTSAKTQVAQGLSVGPDGLTAYHSACQTAATDAGKVGLTKLQTGLNDLAGCAGAYQMVLSVYDSTEPGTVIAAPATLGGAFTTIESDEPGTRFISPKLAHCRQSTFNKNVELMTAAAEGVKKVEEMAANKETKRADLDAQAAQVDQQLDAIKSAFAKAHPGMLKRKDTAVKDFLDRLNKELELQTAQFEELVAAALAIAQQATTKYSRKSFVVSGGFVAGALTASAAFPPGAPFFAIAAALGSLGTNYFGPGGSKKEVAKQLLEALKDIEKIRKGDSSMIEPLVDSIRMMDADFTKLLSLVAQYKAEVEKRQKEIAEAKAKEEKAKEAAAAKPPEPPASGEAGGHGPGHSKGEHAAEIVATGSEATVAVGEGFAGGVHLAHAAGALETAAGVAEGVALVCHGVGPTIHGILAILDANELAKQRTELKEKREKVDELRAELKLPALGNKA